MRNSRSPGAREADISLFFRCLISALFELGEVGMGSALLSSCFDIEAIIIVIKCNYDVMI